MSNHDKVILTAETYQAALKNREFKLFIQPKVTLSDYSISGGEALLRWEYKDDIIMPNHILPFIDAKNEHNSLTFYVVNTALELLKDWRDRGGNLTLSVNVPAMCMTNIDFYRMIFPSLRQHAPLLQNLVFEITEQSVFSDLTPFFSELKELREMGVKLSIDDFGTGHSSLIRLMELPFSELKIDRSMIMKLPENEKTKMILEVIFELACKMKMKICAEGVETKEQEAFLRTLGCDTVQGYLYAKAMPPEDFLNFVENFRASP